LRRNGEKEGGKVSGREKGPGEEGAWISPNEAIYKCLNSDDVSLKVDLISSNDCDFRGKVLF
jgi:hypothetical protein